MSDTSEPGFELEDVTPQTPETKAEGDDVKALIAEYDEARKFDEPARAQYEQDRAYARGQARNWASDANLIGSFIDILVAFLYARDPDVSARAAPKVGGVNADDRAFAETASIVVSRLWKQARLKRAAKKQVRSTLTVGAGWLKVIMNNDVEEDPMVRKQLNEIGDNIDNLRATLDMLDDPEMSDEDLNAQMAEAQRLQASLEKAVEVVHRYGIAVDFVRADDMQISLDVDDITDHLDADWNGHELYIKKSNVLSTFPRLTREDLKKATIYHMRQPRSRKDLEQDNWDGSRQPDKGRYTKSTSSSGSGEGAEFVRVIEVWDNRDKHIKTLIEGVAKWAKEPFKPAQWTSRFYPFFLLALFEVDGERHPQSLAYRLKKLQDEYSSKRSNGRLTAERSVPGTIFNRGQLTAEDAKKLEQMTHQEMVGLNSPSGDDVRKLIAAKPVPTVDPMVFDTRATVSDMERVSGVQEALSQTISTPKTATEAKIQDQGFNTRSTADRDTLEDVLTDMGQYTAELSVQEIPADEVQRVAGVRSFWPQGMAPEDVVTMVELEIEAGSTGRPNKDLEQQNWTIILPLIQNMMTAVQQMQSVGNLPLAEAMVNLLRETLRRLDERIDVEAFIPQGPLPITPPIPGEGGNVEPQEPRETAADVNTLV